VFLQRVEFGSTVFKQDVFQLSFVALPFSALPFSERPIESGSIFFQEAVDKVV